MVGLIVIQQHEETSRRLTQIKTDLKAEESRVTVVSFRDFVVSIKLIHEKTLNQNYEITRKEKFPSSFRGRLKSHTD